MINDPEINRSNVSNLINEAKRYRDGGRVFKFNHISRVLNGVSHALVQFSHVNVCTKVWLRSSPDYIRLACILDGTTVAE